MINGLRLIIYLFVSLYISMPCFSQAEKGKEKSEPAGQLTSLQKSLLIPGWGQIAEKRYFEGILFLSAEVFCLYKTLSYNHKGNYYYERYRIADNVSDAVRYRELTEKYDVKRNKLILASAGIWAINLVDIYFIAKNKEKRSKSLKLKIKHNEAKDLALTISYSF